jgi:hypothetical protein
MEDYDNLTTIPIKYHTVGLTSGSCRSSQELSEIGTPCHLTKPACKRCQVHVISGFHTTSLFQNHLTVENARAVGKVVKVYPIKPSSVSVSAD